MQEDRRIVINKIDLIKKEEILKHLDLSKAFYVGFLSSIARTQSVFWKTSGSLKAALPVLNRHHRA